MDLSFFRRAQMRFASGGPARLDYGVLVATLEAMQSASAAARAVRGLGGEGIAAPRQDALVELLLGGPGWRDALVAQGGCFNAAQAAMGTRRG
jgi:nitroreductase